MKKIRDDGQYGYRLLYPDFSNDTEAHAYIEPILTDIENEGFEVEEFNHKISAVNASSESDAQRLIILLEGFVADKKIVAYDTTR